MENMYNFDHSCIQSTRGQNFIGILCVEAISILVSVTYIHVDLKFHLLATLGRFFWSAVDISRSLCVISVNDGRSAGSGDQHSSINFFHSESQRFGIGGLSVLFTIPPSIKR